MYSVHGVNKTITVEKTSIIIFGVTEKQLCCENSF